MKKKKKKKTFQLTGLTQVTCKQQPWRAQGWTITLLMIKNVALLKAILTLIYTFNK